MNTTRVSLLLRVRDRDDSLAWGEFVDLYRPMLLRYAGVRGLGADDAEDVAQYCLAAIARKIGDFEYDHERGRFRGWLRKMVNDRVSNLLRARRAVQADSDDFRRPQDRERVPESVWDQIVLEEHMKYCLEQLRKQIEPHMYEAFRRVAIDEQPVDEVCRELDLSANQVYLAKSRVTRRLRDLMHELLGDEE